jgi:inhibitor of cysteine peptidase
MMRVILLAVMLMACTPGPATKTERAESASLPAPTPQDVAVRIGADRAGQTVEVAVGQTFAVELVGVPTAGYVWALAQAPAFVTASGEVSGNTSEAQNQPGFAGGNHWEVFVFTASASGEGELVFQQRRPWEASEPPTDTFRVTIVAR